MKINSLIKKIMTNKEKELSTEELMKIITGSEKLKMMVSLQSIMKDDDLESIMSNLKINKTEAARFKAFLELKRKTAKAKTEKRIELKTPEAAAKMAIELLRYRRSERLIEMLIDVQGRLISVETLNDGNRNAISITPDRIFKQPIIKHATAIILAHNHPSGDPTPSEEDINVTRDMQKAGKFLGIKVVDHIIVGDGKVESIKARGLIKWNPIVKG